MKPIEKVSLEFVKGAAQLRIYGSRFQNGYTVSEHVPLQTGACLPQLRKDGAQKAKMLGVPFVDRSNA